MKIGVISSTVFRLTNNGGLSGYGGLEVIAWHCARGLATKGHTVIFFAPDGSECPGCNMVHFGPAGQINEAQAHEKSWQHLLQCEAIIDHSWGKHSVLLKHEAETQPKPLIEKFKNVPILLVMHAPVDTMMANPPPVKKPCIVCISNDQKAHYEGLFGGAKAKVVYNGVDTDQYKPIDIPRTNRFLFLGRFSSVKSPDIAIQACKDAGVGLDLIGDTSITNEPALLAKCKKMADGKQIRLVGPATRGNCVWWYSQAYAFLHPVQSFREPFGLAPVESMLCGCPVIAWNSGAMRETIPHGEEAFTQDTPGALVSSYDDLVGMIKNWSQNSFRQESRNNVREYAKKFSIQNMVDNYEKACMDALKGGW